MCVCNCSAVAWQTYRARASTHHSIASMCKFCVMCLLFVYACESMKPNDTNDTTHTHTLHSLLHFEWKATSSSSSQTRTKRRWKRKTRFKTTKTKYSCLFFVFFAFYLRKILQAGGIKTAITHTNTHAHGDNLRQFNSSSQFIEIDTNHCCMYAAAAAAASNQLFESFHFGYSNCVCMCVHTRPHVKMLTNWLMRCEMLCAVIHVAWHKTSSFNCW